MSRAWTWRHAIIKTDLPATTKHVLLVVSCHMNEVGEGCYPSTKTLAERCSLSERSVCTHLEAAENAGWLRIKRHGFGGQNWARNEYEPAWPEGAEGNSARQKGTEPNDSKALNVVPKGTEPPSAYIDNSPSTSSNTSPSPQPPKGAEEVDDFDRFWYAYPRKVGKPNALRAWKRHKPDLPVVLDAIRRWKTSDQWTKNDGIFIPYPASWLNSEGWNDVIPGEKVAPSADDMKAAQERIAAKRRENEERDRRMVEDRRRQLGLMT